MEPRAGPQDAPAWAGSPGSLFRSLWMSGARQVLPFSELDPAFWSSEPGLGGVQESGSIFHLLSPFPELELLPLGHQAGRGILVLLDQTLHPTS